MSEMITGRTEDIHGNHTGYFYADVELRDLFAVFALVGFIQSDFARTVSHPDKASADCYGLADAMLAQRAQSKEQS